MHRFRFVAQVADLQPGERPRPVQRLGDARRFTQFLLADEAHHIGDLQCQIGVDTGQARQDDPRFAVDIRIVDIMVEAATTQRVAELACSVRCQDDPGDGGRGDRPQFGNRNLEVRQQFEQKRLEFLVGPVHLVYKQNGRLLLPYRGKQWPFQQIGLAEDMLLDRGSVGAFARLDSQQLTLIVPFIQRRALVEPLVALQADQLGVVGKCQGPCHLRLANAGLAFQQQRALEAFHQP